MATFYDILTHDGDFFYSNHASLLLVATADQNYFTDEGGSLSGPGQTNFVSLSLNRLVLATMPRETNVVVGGLGDFSGGTYSTSPSFDKTAAGVSDGEAVQFRGNGIVSFSASAGPRSNSDKYGVGADRLIAISVKGGADSYGFVARSITSDKNDKDYKYKKGDLTIRGDAAANITVLSSDIDGGSGGQRFEQYFDFYNTVGVMTTAYRAMKDLTIKKDLTGTLTCETVSNSVYIPRNYKPSPNSTTVSSDFIKRGHFVYGNGFGANAIAAENITVEGEMNAFATISTLVKDYDATFYYLDSQPNLASIQSVGIAAIWNADFGNVSGGTISTGLSNATAYLLDYEIYGYGKGTAIFRNCRMQSVGVKANHITVHGDFAPEKISANANNISDLNCNVAGIFASNQVDMEKQKVLGGRIDVAGDIAGKIELTVDSIGAGSQYPFSLDFRSRQWAAGIAAESATLEKVRDMSLDDDPRKYYDENLEYGLIKVSGKIRPDIDITVTNSGGSSWFYAYGLRASTINADDVSPDVNITIDNSNAMGIGIFAREGINTADGTAGQSVVNGNITINRNGVGVMGFGSNAMNLLIKGSIEAEYAIVSGIRDKAGRSLDSSIPDNYRISVFKDGATYYLFGQNDVLELAAGAKIKGDIDLGDGQNTITIDSNAALTGAIDSTLGTLRTNFKLNGEARSDAVVTLTRDCSLTESVGGISIDADNARQGTYTLIDAAGTGLSFDGQKISVAYGKKSYFLSVGGDSVELADGLWASAAFAGNKMTFSIGDTGIGARKVSGLAAEVDARSGKITVSWDKFTLDCSYDIDYKIMNSDGSTAAADTVHADDNSWVFSDIATGQHVEITVTATDYGDSASDVLSTEIMPTISPWQITSLQQQKLFVESEEDSLLYSLMWNSAPISNTNTLPLSHYEIQYIESSDVSNDAPDWDSPKAVTKYSTDTSLIVSGLRDVGGFWWRVRAVDVGNNAGDWSKSKNVGTKSDTTAPTINRSLVTSSCEFDVGTGVITANVSFPLAEDDGSGVGVYRFEVANVVDDKTFAFDILQSELLSGDETVQDLGDGVSVRYSLQGDTVFCELTLPNGDYHWRASVSDLSGNTNTDFAVGDAKGGNWVGDVTAPKFSSAAKAQSELVYDESAQRYYNRVTLSWGRATDNRGDDAFDRYEIVTIDKSGDESVLDSIDDIDSCTFIFDTSASGEYRYYVRAYDKFGNVSTSNTASCTVDFEAPVGTFSSISAPAISAAWNDWDVEEIVISGGVGIGAMVTNMVYTYYVSDVSVTLDFTADFTDDLSGVLYQVQLADNEQFLDEDKYRTRTFVIDGGTGSAHTLTLDADSDSTGFAAGALLGMDKIYYRVRAVDSIGNASMWHNCGSFNFEAVFNTTSPDENPPTGLTKITDGKNPSAPTALSASRKGDTATFSWGLGSDVFGVEKYKVALNGKSGGSNTSFEINAADLNVTNGRAAMSTSELTEGIYSWSVTACDYSGRKASANGKQFTLDWTAPEFSGANTVSVSGRDAIVSWDEATDNVAGLDHYVLKYWKVGEEDVATVNCSGTSYRIYNATAGDYRYSIAAVDKAGNEAWNGNGGYTVVELPDDSLKNPRLLTLDSGTPMSRSLTTVIGGSNYSDYFRVNAEDSGVLLWNIDVSTVYGKSTGVNTALYNAAGKKTNSAKITSGEKNFLQPLVAGELSNVDFHTLELKAVNTNNLVQANVSFEREEALAAAVTDLGTLEYTDTHVGAGDTVDVKAFTLEHGALVNLGFSCTDEVKFAICRMKTKEEKDGTISYSLETVKSITPGKSGARRAGAINSLFLDPGTYYITVTSTNAAKGGNADYGIRLFNRGDAEFDPSGKAALVKFFTKGDNSDDWTDVKTAGAGGAVGDVGTITAPGAVIASDWVGYGDAVDYMAFTLDSAAKLSFTVNATDQAKFTICRLESKYDKKKDVTTYSVKDIQGTKLSKPKNAVEYSAVTKDQLLEAGTYYIKVESTNAKKGGDADYSVTLNGSSVFYTKGDNSDDWTDVKTKGADGAVGNVGTITAPGAVIASEWVGYGDAVDYMAFTLTSAAKLSFTVNATDEAKFTICRLESKYDKKKGVTTYSVKDIQGTKLSKPKDAVEYSAVTKDQLLEAGTYYIKVESTNAKKGGNADYSVTLNGSSVFYTAGDNSDDDWQVEGLPALANGDTLDNWVGFGDKIDYRALSIDANGGFYSFDLSGVEDNVKLTVYAVDTAKNKLKSVKSVTATAKKPEISTGDLCLNGTYVIAVEAPNAAKAQNSSYTVTMTEKGTFKTWDTATDPLPAEIDGLLTTAAGGDKFDYFDLASATVDALKFDMGSGKAKVSFFNADNKAVKATEITMADGSVKKNVSSLTLVADNATTDHFDIAALDDSIRYLKIEAATNGMNKYHLSLIA